jgi:hypothetical protein
MAKIPPGTYACKVELVCSESDCVLRTRVVTGRFRGTTFDTPVPTPGLSDDELAELDDLQHHRSRAIEYLRVKVGPLDGVNPNYIQPFIETWDTLNTMSWNDYFEGGLMDRGKLYEDFLKFRNAREDVRIKAKHRS